MLAVINKIFTMAGQRAMFTGVAAIMSGWDTFIQKYPYYALANTGGIIWQGDNSEESRGDLNDMLDASEQSNNSDIFYLYYYAIGTKGPVTNKTPYAARCPVRVVEPQMGRGVVGGVREGDLPDVVYRAFKEMEKVPTMLVDMQKQINDLKEVEAVVAETSVMGKIGAFLQTPDFLNSPVGTMAVERIFGLLGLTGGAKVPMNNIAVGAVTPQSNNTMEDQSPANMTEAEVAQLDAIIDRLSVHCDVLADLEKLTVLAETKPVIFKQMLSTLRAM